MFITPIKSLPRIFKNEWKIASNGEVIWKEDELNTTVSSIQRFFGIDSEMLLHLFAPYAQSNKYAGKLLKNNASSKDIAFNIQELIKVTETPLKLHPDIKIFISKN